MLTFIKKNLFLIVSLVLLSSCNPSSFSLILKGETGNRTTTHIPAPQKRPKGKAKWKGKSKHKSYPSYKALHIPKGHLPKAGQCRIWYPNTPPGRQPHPVSANVAFRNVPAGAWVIENAGGYIKVHKCYLTRSRMIVEVDWYQLN